jgi:histone acetyltransferase (RNA polymerase elongator complex component)
VITGIGSGWEISPEIVEKCLAGQSSPVEICFFGGSFARQEFCVLESYLDTIHSAHSGSTITFSSYPGDFEGERGKRLVRLLKKYPIGTVELGVPSFDAGVLALCGRDDDPSGIKENIKMLRDSGFRLGMQMMIGLPGQSSESAEMDVEMLASLMEGMPSEMKWDLRIYPCLVLKGTELEALYSRGEYRPLPLEAAILQAGALLKKAEPLGFHVIRIGLPESSLLKESVVAGPYHPAFGELALSEKTALEFAEKIQKSGSGRVEIAAKRISQLTGHGCRGLKRLSQITGLSAEVLRGSLVLTDN